MTRPRPDEAPGYYWSYINRTSGDNILGLLEAQAADVSRFLTSISAERSLYRYGAGKWSIRQVWNHVTDTERAFAYRALWFGRGFAEPLISFDQDTAAGGAAADAVGWERHIEDFRAVRQATLTLFGNLPAVAWDRRGIVSGMEFSVRALAFIAAGHVEHHLAILRERYLAA
jgi:hypothetical protein